MLLRSGPCAYDSKYLSQIDRFCDRAVKYGYIAKFTPTAVGSEIKSAEAGGGGGGGAENEIGHSISLPPPKAIKDIKGGLCLILRRRQHFEPLGCNLQWCRQQKQQYIG